MSVKLHEPNNVKRLSDRLGQLSHV
jgi:hypothetical protein